MRQSILTTAMLALMIGTATPLAQADEALAKQYNCTACHGIDQKLVGPAYKEVAAKYAGDDNAKAMLVEKIKKGGSGVWGQIPMPPNSQVPDADVEKLADWVLSLAP